MHQFFFPTVPAQTVTQYKYSYMPFRFLNTFCREHGKLSLTVFMAIWHHLSHLGV